MSVVDPAGDEQRPAVVAVCRTAAAAEFVAMTLGINGVTATTGFYSAGLYPSVDWAEGYRVEVPPELAEAARELLALLSRDDVATVTDSPS